jgi:hypothetical protein
VASHTPEEIIPKTNTQAPTASQEGNSITLETLLSRWARVADRIQNPVAKRCLMTGKPVEILAGKIVMAFSSNFNRDKLFANEMLAQTEDAIAAEFGLVMRLDSRIDPSAFAMRSLPVESAESPAYEEEKKDQMLESALNAFGGELVN